MNENQGGDLDGRDEWDRHWADLNAVTELNPAQRYRHELLVSLILDLLKSRPEVRTIIDFGSGQGDFLRMLVPKAEGREIFGLELSRVGVEISQAKIKKAKFFQHNMLLDSPEILQLRGRGQLCVCSEVVEHLDEPQIFLQNLRRYVAPGGLLFVTVPCGPMNAYERSIGHRQHFTSETISSLLRRSGFEVIEILRAGFPFFNLYKIAGTLRGESVRADAEKMGGGGSSGALKLALLIFNVLFKFNISNTPFGWQLVALAKNPT